MKRRNISLALALTLLVIVGASGCGPGDLGLISQEDEIAMGKQAAADFEPQNGGVDRDARRVSLTQTIGARIGRAANNGDHPQYPYDFRVLANDQVNANAFPGGIIYLWRGIFTNMDYDEQELAWVAAHEAAHVARQHSVRRIERQLGYDVIIQLLLGKDTAGKIAGAVAGLSLQSYGRDQELEADRVGADLTKQAGYDPTAALGAIENLKKAGGDPNKVEVLFATHPGNTTRQDALKAYFRQKGYSGRYFQP